TYIGIGLSIVCLTLVLLTYSIFKELRTLPGVNLMNLSISLLFAHSLFMTAGATQRHQIYSSIAVLTHYFCLVYFTWISIIAFDTYYTFSITCRTRQRTANRKRCFLAIGWIPALLFVAISYSLDQSGLVATGYGGANHCWINNTKSNIFVFVILVAFSIFLNVIFFSSTVISIYKIKKQTRVIGDAANNRRQVVLFVKVAVLMGFTWTSEYLPILVSK
ncbi:adhesion G-protein coupled receptor G2-like, partial [Stylophora pistillata]|uniref:adhesion G-protein coupled receptor G2-like n=1 Tax=Stylophora pistillata TaxID=50429 RepID=UPI000C03FF57